ncbi:MAG: endonuclease/exonuclease/phosphatase family protein [Patescibacteria group bacterium]|nr:endonuclease/exonuclease/phosphatase family protein [Patescibacteria group bacterium]MDE1944210.1 endonuclease/exonuclease/phosphatase family protein [Patescibacteria group bacterium]MDE1944925.1 endonuclease/exonuclease/phosphatase family protein [Patescibacteria group bacterium]MDE2057446.1 endonuclease/exonuclease/phosphatase family protein [Patescibacteria group bacterium]
MTIYSWNMLYRNKRPAEALAFVRDAGADIFCLQEVPAELLDELCASYPHSAYAIEMDRLIPAGAVSTYSVILSRHPIAASGTIALPEWDDVLPWRTKAMIRALRPLGWSRIKNRNAVWADIDSPAGRVRALCVHLTLSNPGWRLAEFEAAMLERDPSLPTIVAGDFNILEKPHIAPLNWFAGGRISDAFRYRRERMIVEARFAAHELTNPLRGARTQTLSRSQLDHILVSRYFSVATAEVISDRHGSDHHPIAVTLTEQPG